MNNYCLSQAFKPGCFSFQSDSRPHTRHYSANDMMRRHSGRFEIQRRLRLSIALEAATAVTQRVEESSVTYLNRGQLYMIQLSDPSGIEEIVTSTLSIDFHDASHRAVSEEYWKYWLAQQKQMNPRALDIDLVQSVGLLDVSLTDFDKVTFTWNTSLGAKIYVRFKCLSTDFSRMKGVKGIPLRAQMESKWSTSLESSYCKVKLFRDKGAERKNKDDAKQITKQLEKTYGRENSKKLSLILKESSPYTFFSQIPDDNTRHHTRIMTAPNLLNQGMIYPLLTPPDTLMTPSESLFTPSESLFTPSESLFTPSEAFFTPSEAFFTPNDPSEALLSPPLFTPNDLSENILGSPPLIAPSLLIEEQSFQPDLFVSPEEVHTPFYFAQPKPSFFRYDELMHHDKKTSYIQSSQ
ncbi:CP2 transcription factor-domain-containing protein [Sporodiniella umbellata]|nr:CP2 transcription factor-domain-containing protein [Sporodiniella umbellata]